MTSRGRLGAFRGLFYLAVLGAWSSGATGCPGGATGDIRPPSVPQGLSAVAASPSRIDLAWSASTDDVGVAGYQVFRDGAPVGLTPGTSFADTGLAPGTAHLYAVSAHDAAGNVSAVCHPVEGTTLPDTTPPSVPAGLTATAASISRIDLAWSASTDDVGVAGYRVLRDGVLVGTVSGTSFADTGLAPGTAHLYAVAAHDVAGNASAACEPVGGATLPDTTPPSVPAGLTATAVSISRIDLSWTASTDDLGVAGYRVFRDGLLVGTVAGTSFADSGLAPGTAHLYAVSAHDDAGNVSAVCHPVGGTTLPDTTPPSVPGGLTATAASSSRIDLSWTPAVDDVGVAGYQVFRDGAPVGLTPGTSFADAGLAPGTAHLYAVAAHDAAGNVSAVCHPVGGTTLPDTTPPSVPAGLTATAASLSRIDLAWSDSTDDAGVAGYQVFRDGVLVGTVAGTSFADAGLAPGTAHLYAVAALDAAGNVSAVCHPVEGTTLPDTTPPSVPAGLTTTAASISRIDLAWSASTDNVGVAGYRVFRDGVLVATVAGTSFADAGLAPGTAHLYAVAAHDDAGNVSAVCHPVEGTTLPDTTPPSVPVGLTARAVSARRIDLAWSPSTDDVGVAGYQVFRDGARVGLAPGTTFADTGLAPGTAHLYAVAAHDDAGNTSASSLPASATTLDLVTLTPAAVTLPTGRTAAFACTVNDPSDPSCTWSVLEGDAGGTVASTGPGTATYTPPATPGTFHVVARANVDPARSATATVTVLDGRVFAAPMPLISRFPGVRAFASNDLDGTLGDFGANRARDAVYDGWGAYWRTIDLPYPAWLAYDLSAVPAEQRGPTLVAWYNESDGYDNGPSSFTPLSYNEPGDYVLEGNAAPGNASGAPASGWVVLLSVAGNTFHSRSHLLDLTGYRWLRFRATAGAPRNQPGNRDCELKLEVFDAHLGNTDSWAFLGDSITNGAMNHLEHGDLNFAQRVNATAFASFPMYENAGIPFDGAEDRGLARLQVLLANSRARFVGLSYGMNDAGAGLATDDAFYRAYRALVDLVLAEGRIPVIPTISWTAEEPWRTAIGDPLTGPELGLNRQLERLKAEYRAQGKVVLDGPDLWHFFEAHPSLVGQGDIHPTAAGYVAMRNLWAAAALAAVYGR